MTLNRVYLRGWKGIVSTERNAYRLQRLNLLSGPNGSGKTALLDALRFAVLGDTPTGATPEDAMRYLGPNGGDVTLDFDDGLRVSRGVVKDCRKLTLSRTVAVSTMPGAGIKDADAEIRRLCGDFPAMFDLRAFLSLSPDKRRDFVVSLAGSAIARDGFDPLQQATDGYAADRAGGEWLPGELAALEGLVGELRLYAVGVNPADQTAKLLDRVKSLVNESRAAAERATLASREMSARKAQLTVVAASVEGMRLEMMALRANRDATLAQLNAQRGRRSAQQAREADVRRLEDELASLKAEQSRLAGVRFKTSEADAAETEAANMERSTSPIMASAAIEESRKRMDAARYDVRAIEEECQAGQRRGAVLTAEIERLEQRLRQVNADPWRKAATLVAAITDAGITDHLEAVNALGPWTDLVALIGEHLSTEDTSAIEDRIAAIAAERLQLCADAATLGARAAVVQETLNAASAEHARLTRERETETRDATAVAAKISELRNRARTIRDAERAHRDRVAKLARDIPAIEQRRVEAQESLTRLLTELGSIAEADLVAHVAGIDAHLGKLDADIAAKMSFKALEQELTRLVSDAEAQRMRHDVAKVFAEAVRRVRETMMAQLVGILIEPMNAFLDRAGLDARAYCELETDRGKPILELGWFRGGVRVPLDTLSGGETAIYCAALGLALLQLKAPPLKLLLIEAAELDSRRLELLLGTLEQYCGDGAVDHVIVATCVEVSLGSAWNAIHCDGRRGVDSVTSNSTPSVGDSAPQNS